MSSSQSSEDSFDDIVDDFEMEEDFYETVLCKWNENELNIIFKSIKNNGLECLETLYSKIPTKTHNEINEIFQYIQTTAQQRLDKESPIDFANEISKTNHPDDVLMKWAQLLLQKYSMHELETEIGESLRIIAECEKIPDPKLTGGVDFKKIYHILANSLDGKPLPKVKGPTAQMLRHCLTEAVIRSKKFIPKQAIEEHLDIINKINIRNLKQENGFLSGHSEPFHAITSRVSYNPFGLPVEAQIERNSQCDLLNE